MSVQELAGRLREAIVNFDLDTIHNELFSEKVESIEPQFAPMPHAKGIQQVKEKAAAFGGSIEKMHSREISEDVLVSGNQIALGMSFDASLKDGSRVQLAEIITYKVEDGKFIEKTTPLFYENDEQQTEFNSTLFPGCACSNGADSMYPSTAQPNRYVLNPSVLLAIIIALLIIIFLTSMLVVFVLYKLWRPAERSTPYQYVNPSEHQISG